MYRPYDYRFRPKILSFFYRDAKTFAGFVNIDGETFDNINNIVKNFLSFVERPLSPSIAEQYKDDLYYRAMAYVYGLNRQQRLKTYDEKILFLILAVDPDLNILEIYESECRADRIKEEAYKTLGFFNEDFLKAARAYQKKYLPNKDFGSWQY